MLFLELHTLYFVFLLLFQMQQKNTRVGVCKEAGWRAALGWRLSGERALVFYSSAGFVIVLSGRSRLAVDWACSSCLADKSRACRGSTWSVWKTV